MKGPFTHLINLSIKRAALYINTHTLKFYMPFTVKTNNTHYHEATIKLQYSVIENNVGN